LSFLPRFSRTFSALRYTPSSRRDCLRSSMVTCYCQVYRSPRFPWRSQPQENSALPRRLKPLFSLLFEDRGLRIDRLTPLPPLFPPLYPRFSRFLLLLWVFSLGQFGPWILLSFFPDFDTFFPPFQLCNPDLIRFWGPRRGPNHVFSPDELRGPRSAAGLRLLD